MSRSLIAKQAALAAQAGELMSAAPWVVAQRGMRLATTPAQSNVAELRRMHSEKASAAAEAMNAMALQWTRSAQGAGAAYLQSWTRAWMQLWFPWLAPGGRARFPLWPVTPGRAQHAALDVVRSGLAPVHRRTVANARRLAK